MGDYDGESRGTVALVLGLLSLSCGGFIVGIPAWILGTQVMAQRSPTHPQYGLANLGRVLGMVGTVMTLLGLFGWVAFMAVAMSGALGGGMP